MQIKIVDVDVEKVDKGNNKSYEMAEVTYDVGGTKRSHKVLSFVNPSVFKTVKSASKGDVFDVVVEKNAQGYNQWISVTPSTGGSDSGPSTGNSSNRSTSNSGSVGTRTFETAEERDRRQRLIVRQSSLTAALSTLSPGSKGPLDKEAVKALAEEYTDWVFEKVALFDQPNDLEDIPF